MFAFVFVSEGWALDASGESQRRAEARRIHEHPDRIEVRTLAAVDLAGFRYGYSIERLTGKLMESAHRPGDGADKGMDGYVHDSLARLVEACA